MGRAGEAASYGDCRERPGCGVHPVVSRDRQCMSANGVALGAGKLDDKAKCR